MELEAPHGRERRQRRAGVDGRRRREPDDRRPSTAAALRVSLIPHTAAVTTLARLAPGVRVNLEADLIAKYVHAFVAGRKPGAGLTWEKLAEAGF